MEWIRLALFAIESSLIADASGEVAKPPGVDCTQSSSPSQQPSGCCLVADAGTHSSQTEAAGFLDAKTAASQYKIAGILKWQSTCFCEDKYGPAFLLADLRQLDTCKPCITLAEQCDILSITAKHQASTCRPACCIRHHHIGGHMHGRRQNTR